jgi:hypothetical protein
MYLTNQNRSHGNGCRIKYILYIASPHGSTMQDLVRTDKYIAKLEEIALYGAIPVTNYLI